MTSRIAAPDIVSSEHKRDPFVFYARLRAEAPVARVAVPRLGDAWFLTRHEDVAACLMDERHFVRNPHTAALDISTIPTELLMLPTGSENMLHFDGPAHRRLRMSVAKLFTRDAIEKWRRHAESIAEMLLDRIAERAEVDLVANYTQPLPLIMISTMLGVPVENGYEVPEWCQTFVSQREKPGGLSPAASAFALGVWAKRLFHARKATPLDDLASALTRRGDAGEELDEKEFVAMVRLLLTTASHATANLIGSGIVAILENSIAIDQFLDNRELFHRGIEELLRFCAPVELGMTRFVAKDIVIDGESLSRGDIVFPIIAAANRDGARFAAPDRLELGREPNPHLAFGAGPHHCFGTHLARMEIEIALRALFRRFPLLSLTEPSAALVWRGYHMVRGLEALRVRLRPAGTV